MGYLSSGLATISVRTKILPRTSLARRHSFFLQEAGTDARLEVQAPAPSVSVCACHNCRVTQAELSPAVDFVPYDAIPARVLGLLAEDTAARDARRARARAVARARETRAMLARTLGALMPACRRSMA